MHGTLCLLIAKPTMSALRRSLACLLSRSTGRNLGDRPGDDPSSTALNRAEEEPPTWTFTNRRWRSRDICPVHTEEVTGSIPVSPTRYKPRSEALRQASSSVQGWGLQTARCVAPSHDLGALGEQGPSAAPAAVPVPAICHSCGRFRVRRCGKKAVGHRGGERCEASWRSVRWCGGRLRPRHAGRARATAAAKGRHRRQRTSCDGHRRHLRGRA
jgi:hypothetical protein